MPRKPPKHPSLTERDYEIFAHIMRFRLTTREVLHRLFFSDSEPNASTKVTSRLCESSFLNRYDLYGQRNYFVLGKAGAKVMALAPIKCEPLGPQALVREYATLAFCFNGEQPRNRLTVSELNDFDSTIFNPGIDSAHYYWDHNKEQRRLAFIRVDHGGSADHLVRKCQFDLERRFHNKSLDKMIEADQFMISIVTFSEPKKEAIHLAIRQQRWPIQFRIEVIPDILNLIGKSLE